MNLYKISKEYFLSFELIFLLFLNGAEFKTVYPLSLVNQIIDLTGFFLFINAACFIPIFLAKIQKSNFKVSFNKHYLIYGSLFLIFSLYIFFSYSITQNSPDANRKFIEYFAIIPWCFIASIFIINKEARVKRFVILSIAFGVFLAVVSIFKLSLFGSIGTREMTGGISDGYHRLGRRSGAVVLLSLVYLFGIKKIFNKKTIWFCLVIAIFGLIFSAQRAPWVVIPITFATFIFLSYKSQLTINLKQISFWKYATGLLVVGVGVFYLFNFSERAGYTLFRLESLFEGGGGSSNRLFMYTESLKAYMKSPIFGVGFGLFSEVTNLLKWRQPHNLYIELLLELGIIGFILGNFVFFYWLRGLHKIFNNIWLFSLLLLFIYYFLNAMISGSITDNRYFLSLAFILSSTVIGSYE